MLEWEGDEAHEIELPMHGVDSLTPRASACSRRRAASAAARRARTASTFSPTRRAHLAAADVPVLAHAAAGATRSCDGWVVAGQTAPRWWTRDGARRARARRARVPMLLARAPRRAGSFVSRLELARRGRRRRAWATIRRRALARRHGATCIAACRGGWRIEIVARPGVPHRTRRLGGLVRRRARAGERTTPDTPGSARRDAFAAVHGSSSPSRTIAGPS